MKIQNNLSHAVAWYDHNSTVGKPEVISFDRLAEESRLTQPGIQCLHPDNIVKRLEKMGFVPANFSEFKKFVMESAPSENLTCLGSVALTDDGFARADYFDGVIWSEPASSGTKFGVLAVACSE